MLKNDDIQWRDFWENSSSLRSIALLIQVFVLSFEDIRYLDPRGGPELILAVLSKSTEILLLINGPVMQRVFLVRVGGDRQRHAIQNSSTISLIDCKLLTESVVETA